ncbi:hypothetical protein Tco_1520072, partial [Tanacetum coccineum]
MAGSTNTITPCAFSQRVLIKSILEGGAGLAGQTVKVGGGLKKGGNKFKHVEGVLQMPPADKQGKQSIELRVVKVLHCGLCDATKYPLPKTKLTLEFLRDVSHLRARTNTVGELIGGSQREENYEVIKE